MTKVKVQFQDISMKKKHTKKKNKKKKKKKKNTMYLSKTKMGKRKLILEAVHIMWAA